MMLRITLLALVVASPLALSESGSWNSQSFGGTLSLGQQTLKSRPVQTSSVLPSGVVATRLAWKITTDVATPLGFRIRICGGNRCLPLPGLSGEIALPPGYPVAGPYRFEYLTAVRGPLSPPLTILSNQLTVEYRTPRRPN